MKTQKMKTLMKKYRRFAEYEDDRNFDDERERSRANSLQEAAEGLDEKVFWETLMEVYQEWPYEFIYDTYKKTLVIARERTMAKEPEFKFPKLLVGI